MIPDYSSYSLSELNEALHVVDGQRYPENKAALEAELQSRKESGRYDEELRALEQEALAKVEATKDFAMKAESIIAWYLVVTGGFVLLSQLLWPPQVSGILNVVIVLVGLAYMLGTVIAGIGLMKKRPWSHTLAIGLLGAQVVAAGSSVFSFKVLSAAGGYVTFASGGNIGISASFEPGFSVYIGQPTPFFLGINLFVIWLIFLLNIARKG